jgi:hypothetical protein
MWSRRVWLVVAVALAAAVARAGRARAADAPVAPVEVEIVGSDAVRAIEIAGPGGPVDCGYTCTLKVPPGRYRVVVTDDEQHRFARWLYVGGPRRVTVAPGNYDARVAGVVMFALGLAGAAVGASMLFERGLRCADARAEGCDDVDEWVTPGSITLVAGLAATVTGFVVWRRNRRAVISEAPGAVPSSRFARWRLAPVAGLRWTGLALTGTF